MNTYLELFTRRDTKLGKALDGLEDRLNLDQNNTSYLFADMNVKSSCKKGELRIVIDDFSFEEFRCYNSGGFGVILKVDHDYPNEPSSRKFVDQLIAKYGDEFLEITYHYLDMSNSYYETLRYSNQEDNKYSFENGDPIVSFYELREDDYNESKAFYDLCCSLEAFDWLEELLNECEHDDLEILKETLSKKE